MQYGHGGPILRVGGMVAPNLTRGDRNTSGYEDRRPRTATRNADAPPADKWEALAYWDRKAELAQRPDKVHGRVIPYGLVVDGGRTLGRCRFTARTAWDFPPVGVPLRANHAAMLGWVQVSEKAGGLYVHGHIEPGFRRHAAGKRELSAAFEVLDEAHVNGVREVLAARLDEVSLCNRAQLPHTYAVVG